MRIDVLTLFPDMMAPALGGSVIGRAAQNGVIDIRYVNIRDYSADKHSKVDDYPYGGGGGMVMTIQPLYDAWRAAVDAVDAVGTVGTAGAAAGYAGVPPASVDGAAAGYACVSPTSVDDAAAGYAGVPPAPVVPAAPTAPVAPGCAKHTDSHFHAAYKSGCEARTIYMSPQGIPLTQKKALELSRERRLIIVCGHYEGVDERALELVADEEISIGDYVLTGGEIPAMALIDCVARLIPGVLSAEEAHMSESHYHGLLEYPQYTRPANFMGMEAPKVLLSGNHADIEQWRRDVSIARTQRKRLDMLEAIPRRLTVGGACNMRDLGGYPAANGAVTRWRTFIRSDVVRDLPGCDAEALRDIGLTTVIDLRSETEAGRAPSAFGRVDWIDCHQVSILPEPVIDRSMQDAPFKELYILFADRGRKKLGAVFSIMAKSRGMCLIHCFAGKDRTGIVAALLLLLAGVAEDDVIADYEVSATYYRRQAVLLKSGVNAASQSHILSDRETIVYFIRHIENRYGGAEKYLLGAGVGAGDIEALRGRFVAPAPVSAPVPAHAPVSAPAPAECL